MKMRRIAFAGAITLAMLAPTGANAQPDVVRTGVFQSSTLGFLGCLHDLSGDYVGYRTIGCLVATANPDGSINATVYGFGPNWPTTMPLIATTYTETATLPSSAIQFNGNYGYPTLLIDIPAGTFTHAPAIHLATLASDYASTYADDTALTCGSETYEPLRYAVVATPPTRSVTSPQVRGTWGDQAVGVGYDTCYSGFATIFDSESSGAWVLDNALSNLPPI